MCSAVRKAIYFEGPGPYRLISQHPTAVDQITVLLLLKNTGRRFEESVICTMCSLLRMKWSQVSAERVNGLRWSTLV